MPYRRLNPGEMVLRGDEWWDGQEWRPILADYNCGHEVPAHGLPPVRRAEPAPPREKTPGEH